MKPTTKIWMAAMTLGWVLLIAGYIQGSRIAIGASVLIFLAFSIERYAAWKDHA